MMTEVEFLRRFQRQPNGGWICTKPIKVNGPSGPVMIDGGTSFGPGALFMGLDLAKELDHMAAKHRLPAARPSSTGTEELSDASAKLAPLERRMASL